MVGPVFALSGAYEFETPHVVAEILACDQTDFDQIDEVPVHGGAVVPLRGELVGDLAVAQRRGGRLEALHDGHARACATQTRGAQRIGQSRRPLAAADSRGSRGGGDLCFERLTTALQGSARMQTRQRAKTLARAIQWSI